jgi:hypothetical protein
MLRRFSNTNTPAIRLPGSYRHWLTLAALFCCCILSAPAAELTFSYTDPVGDSTCAIDVTRMVVVFDAATGNYKLTLTATSTQPFLGSFRVNINLYNPSRLPLSSFFQDALNDYTLAAGQTKLILTGTSPALTAWAIGDTVATNTEAGLGNPPSSSFFRSGVGQEPFGFLTNEDAIAFGTAGLATITELTPQGVVGGLMDDVQVLLETSVLTSDQARGLMDKLSAAIASLNRGSKNATCGQLGAFLNQVRALVQSGALTIAQGEALTQAAQAAMTSAGCS